jgi:hypothetical protein
MFNFKRPLQLGMGVDISFNAPFVIALQIYHSGLGVVRPYDLLMSAENGVSNSVFLQDTTTFNRPKVADVVCWYNTEVD